MEPRRGHGGNFGVWEQVAAGTLFGQALVWPITPLQGSPNVSSMCGCLKILSVACWSLFEIHLWVSGAWPDELTWWRWRWFLIFTLNNYLWTGETIQKLRYLPTMRLQLWPWFISWHYKWFPEHTFCGLQKQTEKFIEIYSFTYNIGSFSL